jgi:hypothetical protein
MTAYIIYRGDGLSAFFLPIYLTSSKRYFTSLVSKKYPLIVSKSTYSNHVAQTKSYSHWRSFLFANFSFHCQSYPFFWRGLSTSATCFPMYPSTSGSLPMQLLVCSHSCTKRWNVCRCAVGLGPSFCCTNLLTVRKLLTVKWLGLHYLAFFLSIPHASLLFYLECSKAS